MSLRVIKYRKNGRIKTKGEYDWGMLRTPCKGVDLRIRFRTNHQDELNYAFMMDFDNLPEHKGRGLLDMAYQVLGEVRMYSVFTGGGYHIYVPVVQGIGTDDYACYRTDYRKKMERFKQWLPEGVKYDVQPFNFHATGRVPGSTNGKRGAEVRFSEKTDYPVLAKLGDAFAYEKAPIKLIPSVTAEKGPWRPDVYCPFVRNALAGGDEYGEYKYWQPVAGILAKSGLDDLVRSFTESTGRPAQEAEGVLERRDSFGFRCSTIRDGVGHDLGDVCQGCVHGAHGGMPSFVSGPEPTSSAPMGFHLATKDGINHKKIDVFGVINHWSNIHMETRIIVGSDLYGWDSVAYRKIGNLDAKGTRFPRRVVRELCAIPSHDIQTPVDFNNVQDQLRTRTTIPQKSPEECDHPEYINLNNGVFNTETYELYEHNPKYCMLENVNMEYKEDAECPRFMAFLDEAVSDAHDQLLLRVFFGLALSNEPCERHEQALWLYGGSGTGKTTLYRLLELLLDKRLNKIGRKGMCFREGGLTITITGTSCLFVEDVKEDNQLPRDLSEFLTTYLSTKRVAIRRMYKDAFDACPKGALFFSSNDEPPFDSTADGGFRRIRTIHFWKRPAEPDRDIIDKFNDERAGIFLWALEGLKYYRKNGMPPYGENERMERETMEDTVEDSLEVWCKGASFDFDARETMTILHRKFLQWSGENEASYSMGLFSKKLRKYLPNALQRRKGDIFRRSVKERYVRIIPTGEKRRTM